MTRASFVIGSALIAVGLWFWITSGTNDWLALVPALAGLLILVPGILCVVRPSLHRVAMHVAMVVAVVAAAAAMFKALSEFTPESPPSTASIIAQVLMSGLCLLFVALGAISFINARRARLK